MKILHLNTENGWRGGERQTLLLAAGLQEQGIPGVIGCRPGAVLAARAAESGIRTRPVAGQPVGAAIDLVRAAAGCDLIHCHTGRVHSIAAAVACWHRKPVVVTRRVDFAPARSRFNRFKYRTAAKVVCISEFIAAQLRDWGVPAANLAVIPSAVPLPSPTTPAVGRALRRELGVADGKRVVGNIAALVGHKDQATFLRAARTIVDGRHDAVFVVIGDGVLRDDLRRLRRELGLEQTVLFPGYLPQAERFLPAFDVFVLSSCQEGLGSILLDAFAAGVPVAATSAGGIPEVVRDGATGLLAPVGDAGGLARAISRLLDDGALAGQLSTTARQWVATECSVARMAERYLKVYEEVLKNFSPRTSR